MHLLNRSNFENAITLSKNIDDGLISSSENIARLVDLYNEVSIEEKYSIIIHNMTLPEYAMTNTSCVNSLNNTTKLSAGVNSLSNTMKLSASVNSLSDTMNFFAGVNPKEDNYSSVVQNIKERITNGS